MKPLEGSLIEGGVRFVEGPAQLPPPGSVPLGALLYPALRRVSEPQRSVALIDLAFEQDTAVRCFGNWRRVGWIEVLKEGLLIKDRAALLESTGLEAVAAK